MSLLFGLDSHQTELEVLFSDQRLGIAGGMKCAEKTNVECRFDPESQGPV